MIGFATAYVALAKTLIPTALEEVFGSENLPYLLQDNESGRLFSMTMFTFCIFLPLSLPQELSSLRFSSALGVLCTIMLTLVITYQFTYNKNMVPEPLENLTNSTKINLELSNIVEAAPFITFLYLFQPNVPATYMELRLDDDNFSKENRIEMIDKVLYRSSLFSNFLYVIVGINGYLIFAQNQDLTMQ